MRATAERRVLVIAHFFPPLGGAGVQRTVKFVKYLPDFGWRPYVLASTPGRYYVHDSSLVDDLPAGLSVSRALLVEPQLPSARLNRLLVRLLSWIMLPDNQVAWLPGAVRLGRKIIAGEGIDAIYSTSAPYTSHLIGLRLKRTTGLPWVADFRDEWTQNPGLVYPSKWHRRRHQTWERSVLGAADRVISVSASLTEDLAALAPGVPREKFVTITNGYDRADGYGANVYQPTARFTLLYTGSLYSVLTARPFLDALEGLLDSGQFPRAAVHVRFVGNTGLRREIESRRLGDVVQVDGYLPHREMARCQQQADALLLILPQSRGPGALTGKIFEYLASARPILALVPPEGEAAQLIMEARAGVVVPSEDSAAIGQALCRLYSDWQAGRRQLYCNVQVVERYDRRTLTGRLAGYLDEAVGLAKL